MGDKPKLIGIFCTFIRAQVSYDLAIDNLITTVGKFCKEDVYFFKEEINNYIDIARSTELGDVSRGRTDYADLFISTLMGINKSKLTRRKKKKEIQEKQHKYSEEMVIQLFNEKTVDDIVLEYTKQELTEMYLTFYSSKPLTSFDKKRIALSIYQHIYTADRAKALLGQ